MSLIRRTFPVGLLGCNCSIIADEVTRECIIVDPGGDAEEILKWCAKQEFNIKLLLHTHGHFDHILAASEIREKTGARIGLHEEDRWLYENIDLQGQMFGFQLEKVGSFDFCLEHQQVHKAGDYQIETYHTPGHSPGSVCFHMESEKVLFSGDTLFSGSIGRTDIWKGSQDQLLSSIENHLLKLDESTVVIPGHGESTTIERELQYNPFLK